MRQDNLESVKKFEMYRTIFLIEPFLKIEPSYITLNFRRPHVCKRNVINVTANLK